MTSSPHEDPAPSRGSTDPARRSLLQRYGPLRLLAPWACIIAGVGLIVRSTMAGSDGFVWVGVALLAVGVIGGLVAMWMARRGL